MDTVESRPESWEGEEERRGEESQRHRRRGERGGREGGREPTFHRGMERKNFRAKIIRGGRKREGEWASDATRETRWRPAERARILA